jgi:hypothetical protein
MSIPIFIINKDRHEALKQLVEFLQKRNYTNITIVDNKSTYQPLLDWYKVSGATVFHNTVGDTNIHCLGNLAYHTKVEQFNKVMISENFVLSDSDIIPIDAIPNGFIEDMEDILNRHGKDKVGLSLKIDDLPTHSFDMDEIVRVESNHWHNPIGGEKMPLYKAAIDTTFAVCRKGCHAGYFDSEHAYRTGAAYIARHMPWYYDKNNLPVDEKYYIEHLDVPGGPCWSLRLKEKLKNG